MAPGRPFVERQYQVWLAGTGGAARGPQTMTAEGDGATQPGARRWLAVHEPFRDPRQQPDERLVAVDDQGQHQPLVGEDHQV